MDSDTFFKQISIDSLVISFKLTLISTVDGPAVFVRVLDDLQRVVFLMNSIKGEWKIKWQDDFPMWLFDFEYSLSEAINDRGGF
jgi:hypothetical protein